MSKQKRRAKKKRAEKPKKPPERRVRRTRHVLARALSDLALDKRYDAITIPMLLKKAGVERASFYAHFRGKDDLLVRSFDELLDMLLKNHEQLPADARLAPARELFAHVGSHRRFHQELSRARKLENLYQAGVERVADGIFRRLAARTPARPAAELAAVSEAYAGALFALLRWWVDNDTPKSPEEMDALFQSIAR